MIRNVKLTSLCLMALGLTVFMTETGGLFRLIARLMAQSAPFQSHWYARFASIM